MEWWILRETTHLLLRRNQEYKMRASYVICFALFGSLLHVTNATEYTKEDWDRVFNEVAVKNSATCLGVSKTVELLKKLNGIQYDGMPKETALMVEKLIDVSQVDINKCNYDYFLQCTQLRISNYRNLNLVDYLDDLWMEQFKACKYVFSDDLLREVEQLSDKTKQDMAELKKNIVAANRGFETKGRYLYYTYDIIAEGILEFIEQNSQTNLVDLKDDPVNALESFRREYKRLVIDLCLEVSAKVHKTPKVLGFFIHRRELSQLDEYVADWFENAMICSQVSENPLTFEKMVFEKFSLKHPKKKKTVGTKLKGCLTGNSCHE